MEELTKRAVLRIFGEYFEVADLEDTVTSFDLGQVAETGSEKPSENYQALLANVDGLKEAVATLTADNRQEVVASAVEFVLEGLHLNRRLNCERTSTGYRYNR